MEFSKDRVRWCAFIMVAAVWCTTPLIAAAQNLQVDQYASKRVTHYLHKHRLPLVGAQVVDNNDGTREMHLYGFTATAFGKQDAEQKALKYIGDPTIKIVNSIQIDPSIENMRPLPDDGGGVPAAAETPVPPPANSNNSWNSAIDNIYKNGAQPLPQPSGPLIP